jgi:DNA topoisomerase I
MALGEFEKADNKARAKKNVTRAVERVASTLGNTPTICRKCYIHPGVVDAYLDGNLLLEVRDGIDRQLCEDIASLRSEERAEARRRARAFQVWSGRAGCTRRVSSCRAA